MTKTPYLARVVHAERLQRRLQLDNGAPIVPLGQVRAVAVLQVLVLVGHAQADSFALRLGQAVDERVEDVKVAFIRVALDDSRDLEQVLKLISLLPLNWFSHFCSDIFLRL